MKDITLKLEERYALKCAQREINAQADGRMKFCLHWHPAIYRPGIEHQEMLFTHPTSEVSVEETNIPLSVRLMRLAAVLAVFLLIVYVLAPLPLAHFGPLREYDAVIQETGIRPGALYYTDVPQSAEAELHNRHTIRYFSNKPAQR